MAGGAIDFGRKGELPPGLERLKARFDRRPAAEGADRTDVRPAASMPPVGRGPGEGSAKVHAVGARRDGEGWKVLLLAGGEDLALLDAGTARELARGLLDMADVIEGKRW